MKSREFYRNKRQSLSAADRSHFHSEIAARFLSGVSSHLPERWKARAPTVAYFRPLPEEADIRECDSFWRKIIPQTRACLPVMVTSTEIEFRAVEAPWSAALSAGLFGIAQPPSTAALIVPEKIDWFWVPGLIFDVQGNRVGMGKGYYDRYLAQNSTAIRMSVAYDFQVVDHLDRQPWDQAVDGILTEKRVVLLPSFHAKTGRSL